MSLGRSIGSAAFLALLLSPAAVAQYVSIKGTPTACVAKTTKIRAYFVSAVGMTVKVRVEKVNDSCGGSTFNSPTGGGTIELREGSKSGRTIASAKYTNGKPSVELTFQQPYYGTRTLYAVVATDPNLYATSAITASGAFTIAQQAPGVRLYSYTCGGCKPDYVMEVDLSIAKIRSLLGTVAGTASASLTDQFARSKTSTTLTMAKHWENAGTKGLYAFAIVNFAFFNLLDPKPSHIAFPLKIGNAYGGDTISYGYGIYPATGGEFANQYRYLRFDNMSKTASIGSINYPKSQTLAQVDTWLNNQTLLGGSEIAFGLTPSADKNINGYIPRMFAGVTDRTGDGKPEILFYASEISTQAGAAGILRGFGVPDSSTLMADGGKSGQLLVRGSLLVKGQNGATRPVPHVFAVYAGW